MLSGKEREHTKGTDSAGRLQENCAVAIVDIASMEIERIVPIPHKDWSLYPQVPTFVCCLQSNADEQ